MKKMFVIVAGIILLLSVVVSAGMLIPRSDKANPNDKASITPAWFGKGCIYTL